MASKSKNKKPAKSNARRKEKKPNADASLRKQLTEMLKGGQAHVDTLDALSGVPTQLQGRAAEGFEHTPWQLLEHIRIAQWDILEFSRNPKHVSPEFPQGYWPPSVSPPNDTAWDKSVQAIKKDLQTMIKLVQNPRVDLHQPFPWGQGQNLLREALLIADHNAYHAGQLVALRKALGAWST